MHDLRLNRVRNCSHADLFFPDVREFLGVETLLRAQTLCFLGLLNTWIGSGSKPSATLCRVSHLLEEMPSSPTSVVIGGVSHGSPVA